MGEIYSYFAISASVELHHCGYSGEDRRITREEM